jgi:hypothetical protein
MMFAHFAALAFPSVALLREGLPQPFPIMVCTLSSVYRLDCPSLSFDFALHGLRGPAFDVRSRSQHFFGRQRRWRRTGLPNRSNIAWHNQPMANAAMY